MTLPTCWRVLLWTAGCLWLAGCGEPQPAQPVGVVTPVAPSASMASISPPVKLTPTLPEIESPIRFTSMTEASGVSMVYYGSPSRELYMTEQNGGGTALFDFDSDGWIDLFLSNGSHFTKPAETVGATQTLYRSHGEFHFQDVTRMSRLTAFGFGMGTAAGDFNNDGFVDLFVAGYGRNRLWKNHGDGTFDEVPLPALPKENTWGTSAAFADLDADGLLDLYVVNYVDWKPDDPPCFSAHQNQPVQISCGPVGRTGQPDALYRNLGDGAFENIATAAGVAIESEGKGLALAIADLDGDRKLDVYVANDTTRNFLFLNQGREQGALTFREEAVPRGVAFSSDGVAGSSMGVACGDYNRDGRFDLFVTNFLNQTYDAYENLGEPGFRSVNTPLGLDTPSRSKLAFGNILSDFDLDGWPDLFVANGHIWDLTSLGLAYEFEMTPYMFQNRKGQRFYEVSKSAGEYFSQQWLGRSPAVGDLDNDGDTDLVVGQVLKPAAILRNDSIRQGNSLQLKFIGVQSARQALGCRVEVQIDDRTTIATTISAGGSFQASSDDRVIVATGMVQTILAVRIVWPDGRLEEWTQLSTGKMLRLLEGTGEVTVGL